MHPSLGPHGDAQRGPVDPFRGVSRAEVPVRYASPRERALAETTVPQWRDLAAEPVYEAPSPEELLCRGVSCVSTVVTGLLILPVLFALAVVVGGFAGSLMALELLYAYVFATATFLLFHLLAGLLRWTVQAPPIA